MSKFYLILCLAVLLLFPTTIRGESPKDKCKIGRKCGWETQHANYGKTISDYNYLMNLIVKGGPGAKRAYKLFLKDGRGGEAEEHQKEIEILSEMEWSMGYYEPVCKFRFSGEEKTWWAGISSIRCPSVKKEEKKQKLPEKGKIA